MRYVDINNNEIRMPRKELLTKLYQRTKYIKVNGNTIKQYYTAPIALEVPDNYPHFKTTLKDYGI